MTARQDRGRCAPPVPAPPVLRLPRGPARPGALRRGLAALLVILVASAGPLAAQTDLPLDAPLDGLLGDILPGGPEAAGAEAAGADGAATDGAATDGAATDGAAANGAAAGSADADAGAAPDAAAEEAPGAAPAPAVSRGGLTGRATPRDAVSALQGGPDYSAWRRTADRTEAISESGRGSDFALERLRADLVDWRDRFLAAQSMNAARIETVRAQIASLGPPPEGDRPEDARVAARRAALQAELARLRAPAILAAEAHTHAAGLIREIDTLIRERQASKLLGRGQSPLHPAVWTDAALIMGDRLVMLGQETRVALTSAARRGRMIDQLPRIVVLALLGGLLLARGRNWVAALQERVRAAAPRGRGVWTFAISLGQIALPFLGLLALSEALIATGVLGFRMRQVVEMLPEAGLFVIVARWLAGHFFGGATPFAPLDLDPRQRREAWRMVVGLGWMLSLLSLASALLASGEVSDPVLGAIVLPFTLAVALLLFRFGRLLASKTLPEGPEDAADTDSVGYRTRLVVATGKAVTLVAVVAPLLALLGYATAAQALIYPTVMTLAVFAVVILLQGLAYDVHALVTRAEDGNRDGLVPVLVGILLALAAIPFLSLVWGARVEDLVEVWTRFRDGYSIGETRLSPTDFVTFLLVFGIGFMLTRLVQGMLRTTVLPRTRLDIGGRNAIVAGVGYVGIFLAALLAITSAGLDLSNLAIVAGALSVGIGFGLQNIVSNFVSGIILLIERPISEGDWIEVNGQMGYVRDISVRSTRIETFDRTDVIVPNADLVSGQVTNWTRGNLVGRIIVPVGVPYGTDTRKVSAILREIVEAHPMVILVPPPAILFAGFGADALNFEIRAILRDINFSLSVKSEINHAIAERFEAEEITIPFPQREVWLHNGDVLREMMEADPAAVGGAGDEPPPAGPGAANSWTSSGAAVAPGAQATVAGRPGSAAPGARPAAAEATEKRAGQPARPAPGTVPAGAAPVAILQEPRRPDLWPDEAAGAPPVAAAGDADTDGGGTR